MPDFSIKQQDSSPALTDTLQYNDGTYPNLNGATVNFVMRALTAQTALINTSTGVTVTAPSTGGVQFVFTTAQTATAGEYMGYWVVTFSGGTVQTFPTVGYLSIVVEENLQTTGGAMLVSLSEAKDYLNIAANDRTHDYKLLRFIAALQPVVENICGPILLTTREEWHDGGQYFVRVRRRPSSGFGQYPVLNLIAASEYRGPIEYTLNIIQDPAHGSIYSCMMDMYGNITRRTAGGGIIAFPQMPRSVHIWYQAGQSQVPANITEGALELLRLNYTVTQQAGRGHFGAISDEEDMLSNVPANFYVPAGIRQLLSPSKRAPSVA